MAIVSLTELSFDAARRAGEVSIGTMTGHVPDALVRCFADNDLWSAPTCTIARAELARRAKLESD